MAFMISCTFCKLVYASLFGSVCQTTAVSVIECFSIKANKCICTLYYHYIIFVVSHESMLYKSNV